jgi:hypothetical protein
MAEWIRNLRHAVRRFQRARRYDLEHDTRMCLACEEHIELHGPRQQCPAPANVVRRGQA